MYSNGNGLQSDGWNEFQWKWCFHRPCKFSGLRLWFHAGNSFSQYEGLISDLLVIVCEFLCSWGSSQFNVNSSPLKQFQTETSGCKACLDVVVSMGWGYHGSQLWNSPSLCWLSSQAWGLLTDCSRDFDRLFQRPVWFNFRLWICQNFQTFTRLVEQLYFLTSSSAWTSLLSTRLLPCVTLYATHVHGCLWTQ